MKIDRIYVGCYAKDMWLARLCIASIRHWYPDLPVSIIKDQCAGNFSVLDLEKHYDITQANFPPYLRAFGKLLPCFQSRPERFLYLDADIVLAGPVLATLEQHPEQFLVHPTYTNDLSCDQFRHHYYDINLVKKHLDNDFVYPGFVFNTGQWVGTSGILKADDFKACIDWGSVPPVNTIPNVVCIDDQGPINYVFAKFAREVNCPSSR